MGDAGFNALLLAAAADGVAPAALVTLTGGRQQLLFNVPEGAQLIPAWRPCLPPPPQHQRMLRRLALAAPPIVFVGAPGRRHLEACAGA